MNTKLLSIFSFLVVTLASAQTTNFPPFSLSSLTNYTPTAATFASRFDARIGYGVNLNSQQGIEAMAASFTLAPALAFGGVVSHDSTGWCAGGVTLNVCGTVNAPIVGTLTLFAGDGIAYDFKYHAPANYLFTGVERDFIIGKVHIAPGLSLANTSTRAGTVLFIGVGIH